MIQLTEKTMEKAVPFFEGWKETLLWSAMQGIMGSVWVDSLEEPTACSCIIGDFCFVAGKPEKEMILHNPQAKEGYIVVPKTEDWEAVIEETYHQNAKKVSRYAIKKEGGIFDEKKLASYIEAVEPEYTVAMIEESVFDQIKEEDWAVDLISQFADYEEYKEKGLGAAALYRGKIVSGASSYTVYKGGIEIEIDTKKEYRRKGLALACGAKLILACLERGWYPSWDAQNLGSVALSEKLGYHFDHEYTAYEIIEFGKEKKE